MVFYLELEGDGVANVGRDVRWGVEQLIRTANDDEVICARGGGRG